MKRVNQRIFLLIIFAFTSIVLIAVTIIAKKLGGLDELCTLCGLFAFLSICSFLAELQDVDDKKDESFTQKKHS